VCKQVSLASKIFALHCHAERSKFCPTPFISWRVLWGKEGCGSVEMVNERM